MKLKKILLNLALVLIFFNLAPLRLQGATWSPPIDLEFSPLTNSINGQQSLSGNTVITWLDAASNNYLTSIYIVGASSWSQPVILVSASLISDTPTLAINAGGDAVAAWIQNGPGPTQTIQTAKLVGDNWISLGTIAGPTPLNFTQISIDVSQSDNIIVTYVQNNGDTTDTLFASNYTEAGWSSPQTLFTTSPGTSMVPLIPTYLDDLSNGTVLWATQSVSTVAIYSSHYIKATGTYTPVETLFSASGMLTNLYASISSLGNGIASWVVNNTDLYASVFVKPATSWSPATLLSVQPNLNNLFTSINNAGDGAVTFNASTDTTIFVSSYLNGTWSTELVVTAEAGFSASTPLIAVDPFGNALLVWTSFDMINTIMTFDYSTRNGPLGNWSAASIIPFTMPPGSFQSPVRLVITPSDLAVFGFLIFSPPYFTNIEIILGTHLFPPEPGSNFKGKIIKNRFLTQTDIVHRLTWTPSPSLTVTSYNIYRNGVLIAKIPAKGPFVYDDHGRHKNKVDTYTLVALYDGVPSSSVTLKL